MVSVFVSKLVVNSFPGADSIWHVPALECVTTAFVGFQSMTEHGVVWLLCYDPRIRQGVGRVLVLLASGVRRRWDLYFFPSFLFSSIVLSNRPLPISRANA